MRELVEDLNYDFNYNMFILKNALRSLPKHDSRPLALQWLHKLSSCNKTLEDLKLRNEFMYHMVNGLRAGELCPPFDSPPPDVPLTCMAHMLPGANLDAEGDDKESAKGVCGCSSGLTSKASGPPEPLVQALSPDGGAFLANQPMPRCGAFCYIAVLCKRSS
ncbi:uncharacterized protein LOC126416937 [Schistocerca serialis cubense]|uniref:uncharacterized protein LOC126416937 n=1 Tax=Schistocerca serialis cubense TaxID=2023355 RepID=UPI00214E33CC|nr:uncharacterized protein LOC126416937 [Schistocerca serialis cubense]